MRITNAKCSILKENGNALRFAKYAPEGDIRNIHLSPQIENNAVNEARADALSRL